MNTPALQPPRSLWPYAIMIWMALFATGIFSFIVVAQRNHVDLVGPDYYDQEIKFQQQIDRVANTRSVKREISIRYNAGEIDIALPPEHARQSPTGSIQLYRPSDASLDQQVTLAVGKNGDQKIDATKLRPGLWKVRITWKVGPEEYFFDQSLVVGA
jgi:hypothetical protein